MLAVLVAALLMACTSCSGPLSSVFDPAADSRFETVAELAGALRERLLADRTIGFTYDAVSYPTEVGRDYSGDGEWVVDLVGTNSRQRSHGGAIETVAVGSEAWVLGTDDGTSRGPWRSHPANQIVDQVLEVRNSTWLTQLDSISEAFTLRGVSDSQRGGRSVVEYRLATDWRESLSLTALHLGLPPVQAFQVEDTFEVLFNLTVDADTRLVDARFLIGDARGGLDVAYEFSGWGEPVVEIAPPPADLVD